MTGGDADKGAGSDRPLTVVGLGASAGGLKALQAFFAAVPADSGMAYVVILHLDPDHESQMAHLLQKLAPIPVVQVTEMVPVEPNRAYIIPPSHYLEMADGHVLLSERGERGQHAPIDLFFRSLGEAHGPDAVGIVLSGTGADGSSGLRRIKEAGGITVAQAPDDAEYDSMPRSAIATGQVDLVLPAADMPAELLRVKRSATRLPPPKKPGRKPARSRDEDEVLLGKVFGRVRGKTGHDFSGYKRSTVLRRLDRRMRFNGVTTLEEYVRLLGERPEEVDALFHDLLISVSNFFRDPEAFQAVAEGVVPALFEGKGAADTVRAWVAGSATGEEAYTLAILLCEHAATLARPPRIQVFATDIDENACALAREAVYAGTIAEDVSGERLERFFDREGGGGFRAKKTIRECILFAAHDLLRDPPFSKLDFVSCRNVLIYLEPEAQRRVIESFHYGLNPGGVLFLGTSESVVPSDLFVAVDAKQRIYRRLATTHPMVPRLSSPPAMDRPAVAPAEALDGRRPRDFSYGRIHLRMIEAYAPPSLIVDEQGGIVHLSPRAGRYLRLGSGEPSRTLVDLVPANLGMELRSALYQAFQRDEPTTRRVRTEVDGRARHLDLHVRPLAQEKDTGRFALVVLDEQGDVEGEGGEAATEPEDQRDASRFEEELRRTRQELESSLQARDVTIEELQSANEELHSVNEEQKANTEELETSREELQSINEELATINEEHRGTIEELERANADIQNLIGTTEIGTIFLDRSLRVRRFTPSVTKAFNLAASDQGRPISHVTHGLRYPELTKDLDHSLASLERVEREVSSDAGAWYDVRIHPYRSADDRIDGLVLTCYDITEPKRLEVELREAVRQAEEASRVKDTFMATLSHEFRTPLNGILGHADILALDERLDKTQKRSALRIKAGVRHLSTMIDELLSLARAGAGRESIQLERVEAGGLAREAIELCETMAVAKGLELEFDLPRTAIELETDHGRARQVLVNLVGNAIKYTERGGVRLEVRSEAERVVFRVHDTGIGIASEHQERVFERFWQVSDGHARAATGMGLGLAAAREFSRLLGGDVEVRSEQGRGSVFTLWLPRGGPLRERPIMDALDEIP